MSANNTLSQAPSSYNDPGRKTLVDADVKGVASAVLALTREVWVLTDRLAATEAILAARGIDIRDEIEHYSPDPALRKVLDERGAALVDSVVRAMAGMDGEEDAPAS